MEQSHEQGRAESRVTLVIESWLARASRRGTKCGEDHESVGIEMRREVLAQVVAFVKRAKPLHGGQQCGGALDVA